MNKPMKLTVLGLVSALMINIAAPMTAQAGTLTIYNQNCTHKSGNWQTKKSVRVYVFQGHAPDHIRGCTDEHVTVRTGQRKTIELRERAHDSSKGGKCGNYKHEAVGTTGGKKDVPATGDSRVVCKKDWIGVCQCTKT